MTGSCYWVDAASANEKYFINMATAGFGAQVTANTPVGLKNYLGGGTYTLSGLVQSISFQPFQGTVKYDGNVNDCHVVVGTVCNGRMAGGGQRLSPTSFIDDGYLDVFSLERFGASDVGAVIEEFQQLEGI